MFFYNKNRRACRKTYIQVPRAGGGGRARPMGLLPVPPVGAGHNLPMRGKT